MHSGSKYHRWIVSACGCSREKVDVYSVLEAFDVRCPARQHAIKKLLCAGQRGKGDVVQDLIEARDGVSRAVDMERARNRWAELEQELQGGTDATTTT